MTLIISCLLVTVGIFGGICIHLSAKIDDERIKRELQKLTIDHLVKRVNLNQECIELQTKCIKDLNGIVKKSVEDKEPTKPDTKALISGWEADEIDEPELVSTEEFKKNIVDICLNGTYEQKHGLIDAMTLQNILLDQTQQCNYHTLQSTLLGQTQQCIYPLQAGQFQSSAMLPLWYINRRLEDM